jgi:hypothetical protein
MKGTKTSQGLRINQVKYQVIRSVVDESSQCYSVYGKKVSSGFVTVIVSRVSLRQQFAKGIFSLQRLLFGLLFCFADNGWLRCSSE